MGRTTLALGRPKGSLQGQRIYFHSQGRFLELRAKEGWVWRSVPDVGGHPQPLEGSAGQDPLFTWAGGPAGRSTLVPSMVRPQVTGNQLNPMETLDAKAWRWGEGGWGWWRPSLSGSSCACGHREDSA